MEWIDRAEALVICGPSGTGKSHLVEALGHLAIDKGKTVAWHTLETLAQLLRRHRADDSVNRAIGKLIRADLMVIDDVGLLPVSADAAEALFRVIDAAYEKRSIAISSNIHPSGFDELMPKSMATATVDRLLHHAHVLITEGQDSYRLAQATAGKGVKPLAAYNPPAAPTWWGKRRPPVGRNHGHQWGEKMAVVGEKQMAVTRRAGKHLPSCSRGTCADGASVAACVREQQSRSRIRAAGSLLLLARRSCRRRIR